jgi:hypothetical protein
MSVSKTHFVSIENDTAFIHGRKNTICGKPYENIGDYTSIKEFITCEKCKIKSNSLQEVFELFPDLKY